MCGRYLIDDDTYSDLCLMLGAGGAVQDIAAGEVFPSAIAPVFGCGGVTAAKWGFPHWKGGGIIINARAETAPDKNMFRKPLLERRCVVPSSGFFEWRRVGGRKKGDKYLLRLPGDNMLFMAGMMSIFSDSVGHEYCAFVILTTAANDSVSPIHDRMPVILAPDEQELWIEDTSFAEQALTRPGPVLKLEPVLTG